MIKKSSLLNISFILALLAVIGRGLLEIFVPKAMAYILQTLFWSAHIVVLLSILKFRKTRFFQISIITFLSFLMIMLISGLNTYLSSGFSSYWFYILSMGYFTGLMCLFGSFRCDDKLIGEIEWEKIFSGITFLLVIVAVLQQLGIISKLPGISWVSGMVRPSSLSGSYLHYPLIIVLLGFLLLEIYVHSNKKFHLFAAVVSFVGVFISMSRSGNMIMWLGFVFYALFGLLYLRGIKKSYLFLLGVLLISLAIMGLYLPSGDIFVSRILNAIKPDAVGNIQRIEHWRYGRDLWSNSNLLIGSHTGMITNVTRNLATDSTGISVVESGFLQQLVNFGLLGTIFYYGLFIILFFRIRPEYFWIRSAFLASIIQTFVYQSIEVFPFMVLLTFFPIVSDSLWLRERRE